MICSDVLKVKKPFKFYSHKKVEKSGGIFRKLTTFADESTFYVQEYMRLLGNIEAKIDAKGRAFLPATFRKVLQAGGEERLVMRKDVFQPCLVLYPESVWNEQMDALRQRLNRWNKQQQQVFRQFVSGLEIVTLDGNGRFLIPKRYQRMAEIEQDIKFVGMGDTIEIWSSPKAEQQQMAPEDFETLLEELMGDDTSSTE